MKRRFLGVLLVVSALAGCAEQPQGSDDSRTTVLDVTLTDEGGNQPTEGALVVLDVVDSEGTTVAHGESVYPAPQGRERTVRLLTDERVPVGRMSLRTTLVVCSGAPCPPGAEGSGAVRFDHCDGEVTLSEATRSTVVLARDARGTCRLTLDERRT